MHAVIRMGAVMALALLGDALLYLVLPAYAGALGLSLSSVGILLSANRFVRLITNGGAARAFGTYGQRTAIVAASICAVITTALYGLATSFLVLLAARLAWGACFSVLRLGGLMTALSASTARTRGRMIGLYQAISRSGPMVGVALAGFAMEEVGYHNTFVIVALVSALGVALAWRLPHAESVVSTPAPEGWRDRVFGDRHLVAVKAAALTNGLVFHGMVVTTIALALKGAGLTSGALALGGLLIGLRSASDLFLATPLGYLSDRVGRRQMLLVALGLEVVGMAMLAWSLSLGVTIVVLSMLALFVISTALGTVADAAAGDLAPPALRAHIMSNYTTWLDLGAALGPAVGLALVEGLGLPATYLAGATLTGLTTLYFVGIARSRPWPRAVTET